MFKFIAFALLTMSFAHASVVINALDLKASKVGPGIKRATFVVNANGEAGVNLNVTRHRPGPRGGLSRQKNFEAIVPELSLVGDKLMLNKYEHSVECGTMGVTRILKIPTLNLSGKCDLQIVTVKTNGVKRVLVQVIAE